MKHRLFRALRTLHIYLTLSGFTLLLFFGVTGVVLVHSEALGLEAATSKKLEGTVAADALARKDRLAIVERLHALGAAGAVEAYEDDGESVRVVFSRPGSRTEAAVRKSDGHATLAIESHGISAVLLDLHRGKQTGAFWIAIDIAGILWILASLTGLVLWIQLVNRRTLGILALVAGTLASCGAFVWLAP